MWWCGGALLMTLLEIDPALLPQHPAGTCHLIMLVGQSFIVQRDNDPKHTSGLCKGGLTET